MTDKESIDHILDAIQSLIKADKAAVRGLTGVSEMLGLHQKELLSLEAKVDWLTERVKSLELIEEMNDSSSIAGKA